MNILRTYLLLFTALSMSISMSGQRPYGIVIHGGAGSIRPDNLSEERQAEYKKALIAARDKGYSILESGGSAEDAIVAAIKIMEDNPLFNAGKGSVLSSEGTVSMDASMMRGRDLQAGSAAGITTTKNPIALAHLILNQSEHVMLSGEGADEFGKTHSLPQEKPSYFITDRMRERLKEVQDSGRNGEKGDAPAGSIEKYGTVGAVALDQQGNLAAGTSTGGMTNKKFDRIGDSPVIGAGTYANNRTCAVSCTGHGEYFIRLSVAHEISALMEHRKWDLEKSASYVVHKELEDLGGKGGVIAIDRRGNVTMPFNTDGMFRAYRLSTGASDAACFK